MKTKLILSTETKEVELWMNLPFLPRLNEWINLPEILSNEDLCQVKLSAQCWSGIKGTVETIEYRKDATGYYAEIIIWCED